MSGVNDYLRWDGWRLDDPAWQGIRYVDIDYNVPGFFAVITAHLARPADSIPPESIVVTGGRRITDLTFELDLLSGASQFTLSFPQRGDHSNYYVELTNGGANPLHPHFRRAAFNFYVRCETGDCRPEELSATQAPELPPSVDLAQKDFKGFMRMLSDWVRVRNPFWADLSPASTERMLLELLSHQADLLSCFQDRTANEAFLDTARERYSMRQHGQLLGYKLFDGQAATTLVGFDVINPGFVPENLEVSANRTASEAPLIFYVTRRTAVHPNNNSEALRPAAWPGAVSAAVAPGATKLLLWGQTAQLSAGMQVVFVQGAKYQVVTLRAVRRLDLPGWVALPTDAPHTGDQPVLELEWNEPLAAAYQPWANNPPFRLWGNLAHARHGQARRAFMQTPAQLRQGDVILQLNRRNHLVTPMQRATGPAVPLLRALQAPESPVLFDEFGQPLFALLVEGEQWFPVEHLGASQSYDTHYIPSTDENGRLWLQFGDGTRGREVPFDVDANESVPQLEMRYRSGDPLAGNCSRDTLTVVVAPPQGSTEADALAGIGGNSVRHQCHAGQGR